MITIEFYIKVIILKFQNIAVAKVGEWPQTTILIYIQNIKRKISKKKRMPETK